MKWIKTAIGAVIGISVIPLVVLSVINIKEPLETTEEITITIELEYQHPQFDTYRFNHTLQIEQIDDLYDYFEKGYTITNLYDYTNDINITITYCTCSPSPYSFLGVIDNNSVSYVFKQNYGNIDQTYDSVYNTNATDIELMDIILTKNPTKIHKLVATLISVVPLVFAGGVVLFFYKPFKKD